MANCKKRSWGTRECLKSSEKTYRNVLFNELQTRVDKYPISDKSKCHVVAMLHHKLIEGLKK